LLAPAVAVGRDHDDLVAGIAQALARAWMPGASTPSSLLTSTRMALRHRWILHVAMIPEGIARASR
jgi:hypothetical protein